jgi:hypothetical protein
MTETQDGKRVTKQNIQGSKPEASEVKVTLICDDLGALALIINRINLTRISYTVLSIEECKDVI